MPTDLIDVITASVESATDPEPEIDSSDTPDTPDIPIEEHIATDDGMPPAPDIEISPTAEGTIKEPAKPESADELTKELEALGVKAPIKGERENRLPYSRVKKIIENSRKKLTDAHTAALKERDVQFAEAKGKLDIVDAADHLIATDPDRYMRTLASIRPEYQKFLQPAQPTQIASIPTQSAVVDTPAPPPDALFPDGSKGYSPEGLAALLDWQAKRVEATVAGRVEAAYTKRFGPIEQQWKENQFKAERLPIIRAQISAAKQTWGKVFDENEQAILHVLQQNPHLSLEAAAAHVLVPKTQAQRETMRAELLKEINARPRAAAKTVPAVAKADAGNTEPRTMEDVIRDSMQGLKR